MSASDYAARRVLQRRRDVRIGGLHRGNEAESHAGEERQSEGEGEHPPVRRTGDGIAGDDGGEERAKAFDHEHRDGVQPGQPSDGREQDAFP